MRVSGKGTVKEAHIRPMLINSPQSAKHPPSVMADVDVGLR